MKELFLFVTLLSSFILIGGPAEAIEKGAAQRSLEGAQAAIGSTVFKCDGYLSEGISEKDAKMKEGTEPIKRSYQWKCPRQPKVQDAFNEMHIPIQKQTSELTYPGVGMQVSEVASKTLDKNCSCTFDPKNTQTKKPLIACKCTGQLEEKPSKETR